LSVTSVAVTVGRSVGEGGGMMRVTSGGGTDFSVRTKLRAKTMASRMISVAWIRQESSR